ncbi:MAG: UDP-N-acetylglucosamine 2-epimerase (non-hydrolyzing) [Acidobacteriota bacterium]|nr:UDP-N-acetylglucosamine 2-epimerase (non-hydrolyzing) [Acidobacteriota bacterium]
MRILSVVGARPQFIKLAMVAKVLARRSEIQHTIVHTGQHYDDMMSDIFFRELGIPLPDINLAAGSGSHGVQTGEIMARLDPVLLSSAPDWVIVYGDTNSTLAAAICAAKLHFKSAHVEAGLRSFNRYMPEEINRIVADHLADLLFCPTQTAMQHLAAEGLGAKALFTGDVMFDAALAADEIAAQRSAAEWRRWRPGEFALATIHRAENTDDPVKLRSIMSALDQVASEICPVLLPVHPRTSKALEQYPELRPGNVHLCAPVSYLDMRLLESRCRMIFTDSGGVQKEAYFAQKPCITLREETEWTETLLNACNQLAGTNASAILTAARRTGDSGPWTAVYGNGRAAEVMVDALIRHSGQSTAAGEHNQ